MSDNDKIELNDNDDEKLTSNTTNTTNGTNNDRNAESEQNANKTENTLTANIELTENNLNYAMKALNVSETSIIDINSNEELFPKKVTKYKVIKHYIKGEKLGNGSFATVREFVDQKTLKRIAGKIFKRKLLERKPYIMDHLEKEFKLVHKLDHNNVIKLLDKYETETKIYLFMEYGTAVLDEFLAEAPNHRLPQWQCHRYFTQIIEGLDYLHSNGVFHRDIKPDNLIVDPSDTIKICDFGVCHISDWFATNDIITDTYAGTQSYQPPELLDLTRETIVYSGASFDIWSSGVTLYQMVCGIMPFNEPQSIVNVKLNYPNHITSNTYLWYLLNGIFVRDFTKRLTIAEIKKQVWFVRHQPRDSKPVSVPVMRFGDIYRSMTVLPRLESHYYPREETDTDTSQQFVTEKEFDTTRHTKYRISPTIRSNRKLKNIRSSQSHKHIHNNLAKRVLLGFIEK